MGRYTTVKCDLWIDPKVEDLVPMGKLLYAYLLTCPLGNSAGYYRLPIGQIALNLSMSKEDFVPTLMTEKGLWVYDEKTSQVFIPTYLKHNPAKGIKQHKGIANQLMTLTKCHLHKDFMWQMQKFCGVESLKCISPEILAYTKEICKGSERCTDIALEGILEEVLYEVYNN